MLANERNGKYTFMDECKEYLSSQLGINFTDNQVKRCARDVQLPVFALGNQLGFEREKFCDKFPDFIKVSNRREDLKLSNRRSGGETYNVKIDAVFAFVEDSWQSGLFSAVNLLDYLKAYDPITFQDWNESTARTFIEKRGSWKNGASKSKMLQAHLGRNAPSTAKKESEASQQGQFPRERPGPAE